MILATKVANIFLIMIYVIVGPTASGKSKLAISLAKHLNAEIVNADAFQVYKELNIGTAKITKQEQENIPHHLLSYVSIDTDYSVAVYQKDFRHVVDNLLKEGKDVVVVGGTGLYIRASLLDYTFDETEKIDMSKYEAMDNDTLYNELLKVDKESAAKIHKNNRKRVLRALEIYLTSGETKSDIESKQEHKYIYDNVKIYNIDVDREVLYENINKRVDTMFDNGLVNEVKEILKNHSKNLKALEAIGYKEVISYLDNKLTLEECKELIKKNTRNYAKRQVTFFKHQFKTINVKDFSDILNDNNY